MSRQFECSMGDKGVCSIPDPAVVVVGGRVRAAGAVEIETLLGGEHDSNLRIEQIQPAGDDELEALSVGGGLSGDRPAEEGIIATCTCGHLYIIRTGSQP